MASNRPLESSKKAKPQSQQHLKRTDVSTDEIQSHQYEMQHNEVVKALMQTEVAAYHSVTGNLNFR